MTRTVTLPELLGENLCNWVMKEHEARRLTLPLLKAKLRENDEFLFKRSVASDYAYYAVQYIFQCASSPIPEK